MKRPIDSLSWLIILFLILLVRLPYSQTLLSALSPALPCPVCQQENFAALALSHSGLAGISSLIAVLIGTGVDITVTRSWGAEPWPTVEIVTTMGQTLSPITVLTIAVPVIGFNPEPAIITSILYGMLPILQATLTGLGGISPSVMDIASGMGISRRRRLRKVELPPVAPVTLAGIRASVIINIDTATIASAVEANMLSTPIIIGLSGFNTAYVIQGTLLVALTTVIVNHEPDKLTRHLTRHVK